MRCVRVFAAAISALLLVSAAAAESSGISVEAQPQATDKALPPAASVAVVAPEDAASAPPLDPPKPTLFADIDLPTQTMTVSDKSGELYRWPISSARAGYATPVGTFTVSWTSRMHYSRQYDWAPMPYAVSSVGGSQVQILAAGTNKIKGLFCG